MGRKNEKDGVWRKGGLENGHGNGENAWSPTNCVNVQTSNRVKKDLCLEGVLIKFDTM